MAAAWKSFPDDPDVASLAAAAASTVTKPSDVWGPDGKPLPAGKALIVPLEAALAKHPDHLFALHQYIHATESAVPQRARVAADRLRQVSPPGLGHLQHMPTHIDIQTGRWHDALTASERALPPTKPLHGFRARRIPTVI